MLNFIPKRCPSVSLLFGKRPLQRIEVGAAKHQMEIPLSVIQRIYDNVDTTVEYHNKDYNPLKWKDFVRLKLDACHLIEAAQTPTAARTALTDIKWFPDLADIYAGQQTMAEVDAATTAATLASVKFTYPIQGKNVGEEKTTQGAAAAATATAQATTKEKK